MALVTSPVADWGDPVTIDMANAAHAVVLNGSASGSAQTNLTGRALFVDPAGGAQTLTILAPSAFTGPLFIANTADAAEVLTVDDGSGTVATVAQSESVLLYSDGSAYYAIVGTNT